MRSRRLRLAVCAAFVAALAPAVVSQAVDVPRPPLPKADALPTLTVKRDPGGVLAGKQVHGMILGTTCTWPTPQAVDFARMRALGINMISLYLCSYVSSIHDNSISTANSPSDAEISAMVNLIHANGFAAELVPIYVPDDFSFWRGKMAPTDVTRFFGSYQSLVWRWAALAQKLRVEVFAIGSECVRLQQYENRWRTIARGVDRRFSGITTYHTTPYSMLDVTWWNAVDWISLSAYFSLASQPYTGTTNADYQRYLNQVKYVFRTTHIPRIVTLHRQTGMPILFSEVGYASVAQSLVKPAMGARYGGKHSEAAQAIGYQAMLDMAKQKPLSWSWFRGIVWFFWDAGVIAPLDKQYSPKDKMAECVIANEWAPRRNLPKINALRNPKLRAACVATNAV